MPPLFSVVVTRVSRSVRLQSFINQDWVYGLVLVWVLCAGGWGRGGDDGGVCLLFFGSSFNLNKSLSYRC